MNNSVNKLYKYNDYINIMIIYDFIGETKTNVCTFNIKKRFYAIFQENENIMNQLIVGTLSVEEKENFILQLHQIEIPEFFRDYIINYFS